MKIRTWMPMVLLMLIVNRAATIALVATGLPVDVARWRPRRVGSPMLTIQIVRNHPGGAAVTTRIVNMTNGPPEA